MISANFEKQIIKSIEMTAVFEPCDEGGIHCICARDSRHKYPEGETIDEAKENLADAVNIVFKEECEK